MRICRYWCYAKMRMVQIKRFVENMQKLIENFEIFFLNYYSRIKIISIQRREIISHQRTEHYSIEGTHHFLIRLWLEAHQNIEILRRTRISLLELVDVKRLIRNDWVSRHQKLSKKSTQGLWPLRRWKELDWVRQTQNKKKSMQKKLQEEVVKQNLGWVRLRNL